MHCDTPVLPADDHKLDEFTYPGDPSLAAPLSDLPGTAPSPAVDPFDANIAICARFHAGFSRDIDAQWFDISPRLLAGVLSSHARGAVRLADMLRIRCALHGPASPPVHIDDLVADLEGKIARLGADIDERWHDPISPNGCRFWRLYSANIGRLSRLYVHQHALAKLRAQRADTPFADPGAINDAINDVLDELSQEWGIDL